MSYFARELLKIAKELSLKDPILGYELESNLYKIAGVPGGRTTGVPFKKHIEETQKYLKDLKNQLKQFLSVADLDSHYEPDEVYLKDFIEGLSAPIKKIEGGQLKSASVRNAKIGDFFKKLRNKWKGYEDVEDVGVEEKPVDSAKIQKESEYNRDYRELVNEVTSYYDIILKDPTSKNINKFKNLIEEALTMGKSILDETYAKPGSEEAPYELEDEEIEQVAPKTSKPKKLPKKPETNKSDLKHSKEIDSLLNQLTESKSDPKTYKNLLLEIYRYLKPNFESETADWGDILGRQTASERIASFIRKNPKFKNDLVKVYNAASYYDK